MKNMRKIASVLLALVMVFALAAPVFAADADLSGHTYKAYQIFAGVQNDSENIVGLGDVQWGTGINGEDFLAALIEDASIGSVFAECNTAADVAAAMTGWTDKSDNAKAFAKIAYSHIMGEGVECKNGTPLNAGYYLVVDETVFEEGAENTVYNLALLQLTKKGEFEIANKTDVPEVEKKVQDTNDSTGETTDWQDSADYDIGDTVPFKLTATLASNVSDYETYKIVFCDTMSKGLTFGKITKVTVDGQEITNGYVVDTVANENGTTSLTITFDNVKEQGGTDSSEVVVEYTATLNDNAVIGSAGNPNEVYLEYSNNPNGEGEGKTPKDKVIVFTFKVIVNKVDEDGAALAGAGFTLFKLNKATGEYVKIGNELTGDQMTQFVWEGLDDGDYKLKETTTPANYNTIDPVEFTITAEHDVEAENPQLTKLEAGDIFTGEVDTDDILSADIENKYGVQLPETGGMGTTLFYVFGAVMVLAAVILLVTKKRMASAK